MRAFSDAPASSSCALSRRTCLFWLAARELLECTRGRVFRRRAARALQLTIARCIIAESSGVQRKTQMGIIFGATFSIVYFEFRARLREWPFGRLVGTALATDYLSGGLQIKCMCELMYNKQWFVYVYNGQ